MKLFCPLVGFCGKIGNTPQTHARCEKLMVLGGVFERHPHLKLVCAKGDVGWMSHQQLLWPVILRIRIRRAPLSAIRRMHESAA